jgi:Ca2+-binding RTX toxin-like protein
LGGAGNDTLTGGGAADTLNGGEGSDLYILGSTGDFAGAEVYSDSGTGLLDVDEVRFTTTANSTFTLGASFSGIERAVIGTGTGAQAVATGTANININATALNVGLTMIGNGGVNALTGSAAGDSMEGGGGNDNLVGNGGDDSLLGGIGNDSLLGGEGQDLLLGGLGADTLNGGVGSDTLRFAAGDTGQTTATRDTVQGFELGAIGVGDVIDYAAVLQIGGSNLLASATQASINQLTGVATFAAGSGTTLADALADIAGSFTAAGNASGEFAFFRINNAGNINLFVSDGVAGVGANDVLVELVGITTVGSIALNNGDLMLL